MMNKNVTLFRLISVFLALMLLLSACQPAHTPVDTKPTKSPVASKPTGTDATEPTVPTQPVTTAPTNPTQPSGTEPTDPTQPSGTEPTDPTQPSGTEPTDPTQPHEQHTDENRNEKCDQCGIDVTVELDFYVLNDLHGVFLDTAENPGVDEMTTFFKNAYADDRSYEILLSSGDMWQGSVESGTNKGQLITQWMNYIGVTAMTLGNHEFDWGSSYIAANAQLAEFPFLGINVTDSNVTSPYCQSSVVIERGGVKIGIIGAIGDVLSSISGEFTPGLDFAVERELTALVKAESTRLRNEGCQLIVYSIHAGYGGNYNGIQYMANYPDYYDLELSQGYVDLVFEAHSHCSYVLQDRYGVYHLQGGGENRGMSYASICYNLVTESYEVQTVEILDHQDYANPALEDDPIVQELVDQYFEGENPHTTVLGNNDKYRSSEDIARKVAQLYWQKGKEVWGDQYTIVLGGGYIKTRSPYDLSAGPVTYAELASLLPFDNTLVLCSIKGRDLRQRFINSNSYVCAYDYQLPGVILDTETYYIITDTYNSTYAPNKLTEVARLDNVFARDLLKEFISKGGWGAATQTVSIAEANEIGAALGANETTTQMYSITGTVTQIINTTWGNLYLQDEAGDTFYIYGLYDSTGVVRYDSMAEPPQVGDTITVTGYITKYISSDGTAIIEIKNACML